MAWKVWGRAVGGSCSAESAGFLLRRARTSKGGGGVEGLDQISRVGHSHCTDGQDSCCHLARRAEGGAPSDRGPRGSVRGWVSAPRGESALTQPEPGLCAVLTDIQLPRTGGRTGVREGCRVGGALAICERGLDS